jgi:acyl carrier protein
MDKETILMTYVKEELLRGRGEKLTPEDDLLSQGIIDSLGILQLVGFIEDRFGMQVPDEDVVYENFHSMKALAAYLDK